MGQDNFNNQKSSNYKIIKQLGEGGFGKAYKVQNKLDKNFYVIKKIPIKSNSPEELKSIENEALILKEINSEYIVKYIDSFIENEYYNIVMEYCENKDLKSFIKNHKDNNQLIHEEVIYNIVLDICYGIKEMHLNNLIHRDLKPDNLFIGKDYKIKIGDFGISKKLINSMKYANTGNGTYNYMAPEMINGQKYNKKVDIWALGCILYELFTLNFCFDCTYIGGLINDINKNNHGKIDTNIFNIEWQNIIDLLLKTDYHERPEIDEVIESIKKIKESNLIKTSNLNDLDNISLNILQRNEFDKVIILNNEKKGVKKDCRIMFVGEAGIGAKTSLIERLINNKFPEGTWPTVGFERRLKKVLLKNKKLINLIFHDTCGQRLFCHLLIPFIENADCIILGFCDEETFLGIKDFWYPYVKDFLNGQIIYLIRNKIDLVQDREAEGRESRKFAEENKFRYFELSCKTGEGVQEFFDDLITLITKIYI